jgi:hypothetical protein
LSLAPTAKTIGLRLLGLLEKSHPITCIRFLSYAKSSS